MSSETKKGRVRALPRIRFHIMSAVNKFTGFSPFHLSFGYSPSIIPPLTTIPLNASQGHLDDRNILKFIQADVANACDNAILAKITHAFHVNGSRGLGFNIKVGDKVMLNTVNR